MAGILANTASKTMVSGDTAVSKVVTGYQLNERVALTTYPTGTDYAWALGLPSGAGTAAVLTSTIVANPSFVPTAAGQYTITVDVDGTAYTMYLTVNAAAVTSGIDIWRCQPVADTDVATPPAEHFSVYNSSTQSSLAYKDDAGVVYTIDSTVVP